MCASLLNCPQRTHSVVAADPVGEGKEGSRIDKIFETVGITYTHDNAEILKQNDIEVEKAKNLLVRQCLLLPLYPLISSQRQLKSSGKSSGRSSWLNDHDSRSQKGSRRKSGASKRKSANTPAEPAEPKAQWPPVRKHHHPKVTPQQQ